MNGLFGFGWVDTIVKLIVFVCIGIMVILIKNHYPKEKNDERGGQ